MYAPRQAPSLIRRGNKGVVKQALGHALEQICNCHSAAEYLQGLYSSVCNRKQHGKKYNSSPTNCSIQRF